MSWDYRLAHRAVKNLERFPKRDRERIVAALDGMKLDPFAGDVRPIQGEVNLYRRRVGSYRIYVRPLAARRLLDIPEITRKQSR